MVPTSPLLVRPSAPDADGRIHAITPTSAGWTYVGFEVYDLKDGATLARQTGDQEVCIVVMAGRARASADGHDFGLIGERADAFEGLPWSLYVPARSGWEIEAIGTCEIAVCAAPGRGRLPARVIPPDDVGPETRGQGSNTRHVRNILPDTGIADSLLVVEVVTPAGNWSSYLPTSTTRTTFPPRACWRRPTITA